MPYTMRQVERGKRLVANLSKAKWELGDLALEIDLDSGKTELEAFAEEIGLEYPTLLRYRQVAAAYPVARRRADVSWTVHREFTALDNPVTVLHRRKAWTATTARLFLGQQNAISRLPAARGQSGVSAGQTPFSDRRPTAEEIREAIKEDPQVVDDVLTDRHVRSTIHNADAKRHHEMAETRRMMAEPPGELEQTFGWMTVSHQINRARAAVKDALELLLENPTLTTEQKEALLENVDGLQTGVDILRSSITTGDRSFEDQLADILSSE